MDILPEKFLEKTTKTKTEMINIPTPLWVKYTYIGFVIITFLYHIGRVLLIMFPISFRRHKKQYPIDKYIDKCYVWDIPENNK